MSISRATSDSARVAGALAGTGLVATLGMGSAYAAIACLYAASVALTARVAVARGRPATAGEARRSPWRDIGDSAAYVARTPALLGAMAMAFLINLTALPIFLGLLPYVAREVYRLDQTWLGFLVASFSAGALAGSFVLTAWGRFVPAARAMIAGAVAWYAAIVAFAHVGAPAAGLALLALCGFLQSLCMIPMSVVLLRVSDAGFRGRVMGLRVLAVYGLPLGLLASGPIIAGAGFTALLTGYGAIGAALSLLAGLRWRRDLWRRNAPANLA